MKPLISSVRVDMDPGHDHVSVWNRGGLAGKLVTCSGDGERVARLLLAGEPPPEDELKAAFKAATGYLAPGENVSSMAWNPDYETKRQMFWKVFCAGVAFSSKEKAR